MKFKFTIAMLYSVFILTTSMTAQAKSVLIYGDSLSAAYGMELSEGWVQLLQDKWGDEHKVINASISGETTHGGLQRLPTTLKKLAPEVIFIELGANDGLQGTPIARIRANLDQMITLSKNSGVKVALAGISIPANYGPRYIDEFSALFKQLAEQHGIAYIDIYDESFITTPGYLQADGLHPTPITQGIIRDNLADFFESSGLLD